MVPWRCLQEAAEELREVKRSQEELSMLRQSFERCRKDNADAEQTIEQLSTSLRDTEEKLKVLKTSISTDKRLTSHWFKKLEELGCCYEVLQINKMQVNLLGGGGGKGTIKIGQNETLKILTENEYKELAYAELQYV